MSKFRLACVLSLLCFALPLFAQNDTLDQTGTFDIAEDEYQPSSEQDLAANFTLPEGGELPRSGISKQYHQEIEDVLTGDDFAQKETVKRWRWKDIKDKEKREEKFPEWLIGFFEMLERNETTLLNVSKGFEVLLWALLIAVIVFVIVYYRQQLSGFVANLGAENTEPELPTTLFGLDIEKQTIPDDVVASARQHWSQGQYREALAVLLRASLIKLLHVHRCQFYDSDTESECCDRIDQQAPEQVSTYMRKLVQVWQLLAYAHVNPGNQEFEQLCQQWQEVF